MSKKYTIWQDIDIDLNDWKDFLEDEYPEVTDEYEQYSLCCDMNAEYLDDEKSNLCKDLHSPIVVIANFGLWDGVHDAWAVFDKKRNLADIFDVDTIGMDCGDMRREYYVHDGELRAKAYHHDGGNYYTFRKMRGDLTDAEKDRLYNHEVEYDELMHMTESLASDVCAVYGWEN